MKTDDLLKILANLNPGDRKEAVSLATAVTEHMPWVPNPGPQTEAYFSKADEVFYGGQAGGGKTDLLLGLALTAHTKSLVLRRTNREVNGLVERMTEILGARDGYNSQTGMWRWRDKLVELGGCQLEEDKQKYKGNAKDLYCFDELSDFTESQYVFITGWNRSTIPGQRCRIIGAGNPPTRPEGQWVVRRWAAWLDPRHPRPAEPGELRWYTTNNKGEEEEVDGPGPHYLDGDRPLYARSRTFIPAELADNPDLMDTNYQASLDSLPPELRAAYRDGNFNAGISDDPYQLIPSAWVIAAQARWLEHPPAGIPMCAIGCDVAVAKDKFVLAPRHDSWFARTIVIPGREVADPQQAAGRIIAIRRDNAKVIVDVGGGWGADCYGQLTANGIDSLAYMGVKASKRKTDDGKFGFANIRTEALWKLREALDPSQQGGCSMQLPPGAALRADLCAPHYLVKKQGDSVIIAAETKEDVRDRLGRSPDEGDAIVMSWYDGYRLKNIQGGWQENMTNYGKRQVSVNRGKRYK